MIRVVPTTIKGAARRCAELHRKLPRVQGGMWALALVEDAHLIGVAIVGRPNARAFPQDGTALEVTRVAVEPDPGGRCYCSRLYGAASAAARAMGADMMLTYTGKDEPGTSLVGAGWVRDPEDLGHGQEWSRSSRKRAAGQHVIGRVRWWAPWSPRAKEIMRWKSRPYD